MSRGPSNHTSAVPSQVLSRHRALTGPVRNGLTNRPCGCGQSSSPFGASISPLGNMKAAQPISEMPKFILFLQHALRGTVPGPLGQRRRCPSQSSRTGCVTQGALAGRAFWVGPSAEPRPRVDKGITGMGGNFPQTHLSPCSHPLVPAEGLRSPQSPSFPAPAPAWTQERIPEEGLKWVAEKSGPPAEHRLCGLGQAATSLAPPWVSADALRKGDRSGSVA